MKLLPSLLSVVVLFGASGITASYAQKNEPAVIYEAFHSIQYLPLYVGIDQGIFAKHGVDVKLMTAGSGSQGVAAVIGGHSDFSLQDPMTAVLAYLKGAPITTIGMVVSGVPVWVIAPPKNNIKSVEDLQKKTVSTAMPPSTSTYLFQQLIKDKAIPDVGLTTVQIGTELSPLSVGRADAAAVYEPQVSQGLASGNEVVYGFNDKYKGDFMFSTINTLKSTITDKPEMVKNFIAGLAEAESVVHNSPDIARQVAIKEFPTLDPKVVTDAVNRLSANNIYAVNPYISEAAFNNALSVQEYIGNIKPGQVTYADVVDNIYQK
ncbi:ABC transporter substrate-binding protein [Citrobacter sp. JGM124]|uniref:ABC transporter substrate-binding protein n=1 Tax=Citrobacter sp. JGM124 TaxID=2799789 RepID=UPI001BA8C8BA|nr:ABC transporter substrate-binding protein [Citrobacter sp. JGM124]MBS0849548.1 ABC transporter substrate-binding protein [Citrobacter sp. JGM124]